MTKNQLIELSKKKAKKLGSQAALAREIGCTRDYINQFLLGKRNPPARLLAYLGYKPVISYEKMH